MIALKLGLRWATLPLALLVTPTLSVSFEGPPPAARREAWFKHVLDTCSEKLCACTKEEDDCHCPLVGSNPATLDEGLSSTARTSSKPKPSRQQKLLWCSALLSGADEALALASRSSESVANLALGLGAYSLRHTTAHVKVVLARGAGLQEESTVLLEGLPRKLSLFGVPLRVLPEGGQQEVEEFDPAKFHTRPRLQVDLLLPPASAGSASAASAPTFSPTFSSMGLAPEVLLVDLCGRKGDNEPSGLPDELLGTNANVASARAIRWAIFACAEADWSANFLSQLVGPSKLGWKLLSDEEEIGPLTWRFFVREDALREAPMGMERLNPSFATWQPLTKEHRQEQQQEQQQQQEQKQQQQQDLSRKQLEQSVPNALKRSTFFSGYANPCRYVEINAGSLGLNHFPDYAGSETFEETMEAVTKYCLSPPGAEVCSRKAEHLDKRDLEAWLPTWASEIQLRSLSLGVGTGDCNAGLRSSAYKHRATADQIFADFSLLIKIFLDVGVQVTGFFVNLGAADGIWSDPLTTYSQLSHSGLAVELDPERCEAYRKNFPHVELLCTRLSLATLPVITERIPIGGYDVLKVDLDAYDCVIIWEMLTRYQHRPSVIILEVNLAFPPPFEFAMEHHPAWDEPHNLTLPYHLGHGCSLSYAVRMLSKTLSPPNYVLFQVSKTDALFLRTDVAAAVLGTTELPNEFQCFQSGLIEVHGVLPDRLRKWFLTQDVAATLREMKTLVRKELQQSLGPIAGSEAEFRLTAGGLGEDALEHEGHEARRPSADKDRIKTDLTGICEGGRLWFGFADAVG